MPKHCVFEVGRSVGSDRTRTNWTAYCNREDLRARHSVVGMCRSLLGCMTFAGRLEGSFPPDRTGLAFMPAKPDCSAHAGYVNSFDIAAVQLRD